MREQMPKVVANFDTQAFTRSVRNQREEFMQTQQFRSLVEDFITDLYTAICDRIQEEDIQDAEEQEMALDYEAKTLLVKFIGNVDGYLLGCPLLFDP